jgi:hypothetical protein
LHAQLRFRVGLPSEIVTLIWRAFIGRLDVAHLVPLCTTELTKLRALEREGDAAALRKDHATALACWEMLLEVYALGEPSSESDGAIHTHFPLPSIVEVRHKRAAARRGLRPRRGPSDPFDR